MARIEEYELPEDVYFHKEHMWAKVENDKVKVGLDDFSQKLAGEMSYIELPEEGEEVKQGDAVGTYETGKWLGKLYAPLSGKITGINEEVEDEPTLVNEDPYGKGWIFEIEMNDPAELDNLMKGEKAMVWLKEEIAKHPKKKGM
jgi:glycine cleavage system H protein